MQGTEVSVGLVAAATQSLEQCSSSFSSGTICTQPTLFGPTLREEATARFNGTLAPSPLSLLCISSNTSGVVRTLCHVQTNGLSAVCGDNSWTSAKVIIIMSRMSRIARMGRMSRMARMQMSMKMLGCMRELVDVCQDEPALLTATPPPRRPVGLPTAGARPVYTPPLA